ncbi:hypothetical protein [Flocculibacter collagenilyticus]|uniref:hypothetical protein n=1 Tax=Flocculibacter collagenilyticus TaxID=2744479 RepID=UPI0018F7A3C6|nr:hypothetical protein [Flocculibacter collagenilyticus]
MISQGFEYGKHLVEIVSSDTTLNMLEKGRVDLAPLNPQLLTFHCQTTGCDVNDFTFVYALESMNEDFYLVASIGTDLALIEKLKSVFENGVLKLDIARRLTTMF